MAQIDKLDKLQAILSTQVKSKTTWNEIIMNKYLKYSLLVLVLGIIGIDLLFCNEEWR
jgi:hypothetical protein